MTDLFWGLGSAGCIEKKPNILAVHPNSEINEMSTYAGLDSAQLRHAGSDAVPGLGDVLKVSVDLVRQLDSNVLHQVDIRLAGLR